MSQVHHCHLWQVLAEKKKKNLTVCNTGVPPKGVGKQILKATGTTLVHKLPRWKGTDSSTWSQCITTNKTVAVFSSWQYSQLQKMLTPKKHDLWTMRLNSSMGNAQVQIHNQWFTFLTIHEKQASIIPIMSHMLVVTILYKFICNHRTVGSHCSL